jgi:hypothetical protein
VTTTGFTCKRWRRYGHDRLYVESAAGERVGYRDLTTGLDHPVAESDRLLVMRLAEAWQAEQGVVAVRPAVTVDAAPATEAVPDTPETLYAERPWLDLTQNRPGAAAREQADHEFAKAPVRATLARLVDSKNDERAWRLGARGEELVAAELAKVARKDPAWTAIHAIPVGHRGSDIDHLVLGPGGVFTVNAKHHPDARIEVRGETVWVNGSRTDHVRNARFEAERATRLLSAAVGRPVAVQGLVVTVNAKSFAVKTPPRPGVTVVYRKQLASWLRRLGPVLDQDTLNRIWLAARRSTTWEC